MDYMTMNFNRNGGGGGTSDYSQLSNKPKINGVTLVGNKTSADLGLMPTRNIDLKPIKDSRNFVFSGGVYEADEKIKSSVEGMDTVYTEDGTPVDLPSYDVIQETEMQFLPTQDLHGYNKPWAGGAGFNKVDENSMEIGKIDASGQDVSVTDNRFWRTRDYFSVLPSTVYYNRLSTGFTTSNTNNNVSCYDANKQFLAEYTNVGTMTFITPEGCAFIRITSFFVQNQTTYPTGLCLNVSDASKNGTFEPYSNICPISGQDNATLTDEYDNKYIASLGGTYYGGRVFFETSFYNQFWEYIASYNGETLPQEWISDRDEYIAGTTPTIGAEVAYRLDTTIGHRISVTREPLSRGEITYNGSALYISYQKDNVIGECKKFTVDEIAKLGFPKPPTTDGTYHLECSVSSGTPTIRWVLNS